MAESYMTEYRDYLQELAAGNVQSGLIYEPRVFFDQLTTSGVLEVFGNNEVFRNGEQFPIRITHLAAIIGYDTFGEGDITDERSVQRIGMYLKFHDQYYMNPPQQLGGGGLSTFQQATPISAWGNVVTATSNAINFDTSSWRFIKPFILSVRDTLQVTVGTVPPGAPPQGETLPVTVAFTGIGILSRQPYFLSGRVNLEGPEITTIPTERFNNDGAEPILMTDMSVTVGADSGNNDPTGDSRRAIVGVRQVGNGTNANWVSGPLDLGIPSAAVPSALLGVTTGRAVVHQFPQPLLWEPGEGIDLVIQNLNPAQQRDEIVNVALLGDIMVQ